MFFRELNPDPEYDILGDHAQPHWFNACTYTPDADPFCPSRPDSDHEFEYVPDPELHCSLPYIYIT